MSGATSIGGPTPSAMTATPGVSQLMQRFQSMSPEQLQQTVAMMGGSQMGQIARQVLQQKQMMPNVGAPQGQAAAAGSPMAPSAPAVGAAPMAPTAAAPAAQAAPGSAFGAPMSASGPYQRGGMVQGFALGGSPLGMSMGMADPWWTRREATDTGLLHSQVAGRTDHIAANAPVDSYVIPADVVSGLGEGNTLAGARVLTEAMNTGPHGIPTGRTGPHRDNIPRPPSLNWDGGQASGGRTDHVPIAAAGGEFIVPPEVVRRIGGGDAKRGHRILDEFVVHARKRIIGEMRRLKGPVKPGEKE